MKAWTDYPFEWLGDEPNKKAPVREIEVISYDGDKYCEIHICEYPDTETTSIKSGYIYQVAGRYDEVPCLTKDQLDSLL